MSAVIEDPRFPHSRVASGSFLTPTARSRPFPLSLQLPLRRTPPEFQTWSPVHLSVVLVHVPPNFDRLFLRLILGLPRFDTPSPFFFCVFLSTANQHPRSLQSSSQYFHTCMSVSLTPRPCCLSTHTRRRLLQSSSRVRRRRNELHDASQGAHGAQVGPQPSANLPQPSFPTRQIPCPSPSGPTPRTIRRARRVFRK